MKTKHVMRRKRPLVLEPLESRIVLDGNVSAFVRGGTLRLIGDSHNNEITIEQSAVKSFTISSGDGSTTINGRAGPLTFNGVRKDLKISLGSGSDVVDLEGNEGTSLRVSNRLFINTGPGADQVLMNNVHAIGLHIDLGSQNDLLNVGSDGGDDGLMVTKEAIVAAGSGRDDVRLANTLFKRFLTLDMGSGSDVTTMQEVTVRKRSTVAGGSNTDTLNRESNHGKLKFISFEVVNNTVNSPTPVPPVANNDMASVTRNGSTTINVLTNDTSATSTIAPATVTITQAPTSGTATVNSNGTITYANNGAAATSDTLKYTVKDQNGTTSNAATVTITVNAAALTAVNDTATIVEDATPNTATGNVLTNDTGGTGTKAVSAVNGAAASVGTDVVGQFGTFHINSDGSYTYTLNNSNATVNALNNGGTLTDSMGYTASAGSQTSNATLSVTVQGHTELVAVDDPANVTEDATPNTVTGNVLTNDTGGNGTKTVTAVSGTAASVGQTINGQFGTFNIAANGAFTYTLNNSNATVDALNNGGSLTDSMDYTTSDGVATDVGTLTVTIAGHTDLVAVDDGAGVTEDATPNTATGNVLTNDTGGNGTKTVTAVNGVAGSLNTDVAGQFGIFHINADGSYTYTLNNSNATVDALNNGGTLTDSMNYTASDGIATDVGTLTVTITGHTNLVAVDDTAGVTEDATPNTATGNVLTNDTGGNGTKTVTAVNGVAGNVNTDVAGQFGTFHINADGSYTYTLNNSNATVDALNNGGTLTDSMNYTASDGIATDVGTLTVTITGHTDLAAVDDTAGVTEDATPNTATGNVLTNDTGGNGTKTVTAVNGVVGNVNTDVAGQFGTFHINADGSYTYTLNNSNATVDALNNGGSLTDSMNYTASDGIATDVGTLTVTITGHTELVAVDDDTASITEDAVPNTVTGDVLSNDTGGNGTKTVTAVDGSATGVGTDVPGDHGTFHINSNGTFTYTLDNTDTAVDDLNDGQTLADSIDYTVSDGVATDVATLTVTIQGATDA